MKVKGKRILKNGAIGAYVYYSSDDKWKWRIIGHTKKTGGSTIEKRYISIENKYKGNNISKRLWTLHKTGFMNKFYKDVHKTYTTSDSLDDTIKLLEERLKKNKYDSNIKSEKVKFRKKYINNTINKIKEKIINKSVVNYKNSRTNQKSKNNNKNNKNKKSEVKIDIYEFPFGSYNIKHYPPRRQKNIKNLNQVPNMKPIKKATDKKYYSVGISNKFPSGVYSQNVISNVGNNINQGNNNKWKLFKNYYENKNHKPLANLKEDNILLNPNGKTKFKNILQRVQQKNIEKYNLQEQQDLDKLHEGGIIYKWDVGGDKVIIFGDFHGSYHSFFRSMNRLKEIGIIDLNFKVTDGYRILFCGDIVDRGNHALEIVFFILKLLDTNPDKVIYNRGNHETQTQYEFNGFKNEINKKIGKDIQGNVKDFYSTCPSAVILMFSNSKKIWCCHGCIPIEKINDSIPKPSEIYEYKSKVELLNIKIFINDEIHKTFICDNFIANQIRWNDLAINRRYLSCIERGGGRVYNISQNILEKFLEINHLDFLIRGHQDSYANTVLFSDNIDNTKANFPNGINIQSLLPKLDISKKYNFSEMKGNLKDVTTLGEILVKSSSRELKLYNDKQININDVNAITISTNNDRKRNLPVDSFVCVSEKKK